MFGLKGESHPVERTVSRNHRLDIQGLRAIAVLLVAAFHAGLPVRGGFVGVDVFFVISGFVITGMIHREWSSTGGFRFGHFYLRRFKRLTPALALMVAVILVLSFCLLSPFGGQQIAAQTGIGAMVLLANLAVAPTGSYFDAPAEANPLLHTWSLSVEEQFYLVFPAIFLVGWALSRRGERGTRRLTLLVSLVAVISFGLAAMGAARLVPPPADWLVGFYSPFSRAWEFAAGALLFLITASRPANSERYAQILGWVGVALIAASAELINGATPFPGPWTLLPVAGTLMLIAAGTHHTTVVSRALALPAMVKVGDWSYSIYLWHWPLRVVAVHLWPESRFAALLAVALSIVPAVASYRWVEQPLRRLAPLTRPRTFGLIGAVVLPPILLAVTLSFAATDYWLPRYRSGVVPIAHHGDTDWTDFYVHLRDTYASCSNQAIQDSAMKWQEITRCWQSKPGTHIDVALVGDSHVEQLFLGLAEAVPTKNFVYYQLDGLPIRSMSGMGRIIDTVAADPTIETVIVTADWAQRGVAKDDLAKTFETFMSRNKAVFVTDDVPTFPFDAEACKYRIAPAVPITKCSESRARFESAHSRYYPDLRATVDKVPGVQLLDTAAYFCDKSVCSMNRGDALLYRDTNHLNNVGSRFLVNQMLTDFPDFRAAIARP
ncbi:acyltransferase family protein [Mycobacterium colombiense]|uniref:acyltransferase family protein n=1 Tax=Mycobacterium colombiense TaxID=339268 RepID=UPI00200B291D|nr:acyltransferase family protein [Mycobacterium colombiense]MCK8643382.1 acyltransferase [Mycobacterium colombiense]